MKRIIKLIAFLPIVACASEFPIAHSIYTEQITNTLTVTSNTFANPYLRTNNIEFGVYHTIQIRANNTNIVAIDRSLDGSYWIPVATNSAEAASNAEVTMTGKWVWMRSRIGATNTTVTINYVGGR